MRNTSTIDTFANAIARFTNAGVEVVRAFFLVEPIYQLVQQSRLYLYAGDLAKPKWKSLLVSDAGELYAMSLPTITDVRARLMPGTTKRWNELGKS